MGRSNGLADGQERVSNAVPTEQRPLRILVICHMPWNPNAGGSRVQMELVDEWRRSGHLVEVFSQETAYPQPRSGLGQWWDTFPAKAKAYVQQHGHRFDIIDAHQGNLPFSKQELGFSGLLVARTVGLYVFVDDFLKLERQWRTRKFSPKGLLVEWMQHQNARNYPQSLQHCDLINVPNQDELTYLRDTMGLGDKTVVFPFGLSQARYSALQAAIPPATTRLDRPEVAFIGGWQLRKGSRDWGTIIRTVRDRVPNAHFLFLGTGATYERILRDCNLPPCDWIRVVPSYDSNDLPHLLRGAMVGAFPSYMEGFGFSVLEKLACGIPVVAYDVPGPREMLHFLQEPPLLTPVGDIAAFCQQLITLLSLDEAAYSAISAQCGHRASQFAWQDIAANTLACYQAAYQPRSKP